MRKLLRLLLPLVLIGAASLLVAVLAKQAAEKRPERREGQAPALLVDVIPVELEDRHLTVTSQGTVRPRTQTTLIAEVSGKVVDVSPNFVAGGFFREGETLLRIDPSDYEAAVKRAEANLASRQAQLADQQARSDQALKDWKNLGRTGEPSDLTLRKPQLAEAQAGVQAAEAELQKARRDLARTRISAPYDGLLRAKQVDIGQFVSPGTALGVSFAIDRAEIRLPLAVQDLPSLNLPGPTDNNNLLRIPVRLTAEGSGLSDQWLAEIIRTEGVIDEDSRVVYAVASLDDPYTILGQSQQSPLRMGTFVRAEIQGREVSGIATLPRAVLRGGNTVLVANAEDQLELRQVTIVRAEPDRIFVESGLNAGERVVTTAVEAPIPGTRLTINDAGVTAAEAKLANSGSIP